MKTVAAKEAKNAFGALLDDAQRAPVVIEKKGRPVVVVISKHDFDEMQMSLDDYRSLKETEYLLSSKKNRARLKAAIKDARQGNVVEKNMEELIAYED